MRRGIRVAELEAGEQVGQYEILSLLGRGGMGTVYLAEDHSLGRKVALKMLPTHLLEDAEIVARVQREAHALARLRHPNLAHIYTVGEHKGHPYFAMEYIKGSALNTIVAKTGRLPPMQAAHIAAEVMAALDNVHKAGIIHRDVKPGNIIIDQDGRTILMDFGLARQELDAPLTADHTVLGTPNYMSPEQAKGESLDARTDIYSLGIVLYEMLTGSPPFEGKSSFEILRHHIESSAPAPSEVEPDVPPELDHVVARALAKSADDRYPTVREMAGALSAIYRTATLVRLAEGTAADTAPLTRAGTGPAKFASTIEVAPPQYFVPTEQLVGLFRRWVVRIAVLLALLLAVVVVWLVCQPGPVASPGQWVEIRRAGAAPVRGKLIEIEVLDGGTTTAKIETGSGQKPLAVSIREGDELHVLEEQ